MEYNYPKKSILKWIVLYVIIAAVAYGAVYYFYKKSDYSYTQTANTQTADWKTYTNAEYGFEFQYSAQYILDSSESNLTLYSPDHYLNRSTWPFHNDFSMVVMKHDRYGNANQLWNDAIERRGNSKYNHIGFTREFVAGQEAYVVISDQGSGTNNPNIELLLDYDSMVYDFYFPILDSSGDTRSFNFGKSIRDNLTQEQRKILSTFKFTNSQPLSQAEAIDAVRNLSEVKSYILLLENNDSKPYFETQMRDGYYAVWVYEIKNDHLTRFNTYDVNMKTGEIKKEER